MLIGYRVVIYLSYPCTRSAEVIKQYPNVMVMLDHCGVPYERDEANMKLWREGKGVCVVSW